MDARQAAVAAIVVGTMIALALLMRATGDLNRRTAAILNYAPGAAYHPSDPAGIWVSGEAAKFSCDNSLVSDWCLLEESAAPGACSADPKCLGYMAPSKEVAANILTHDKPFVQLVRTLPGANSAYPGTVFYRKAAR